jgi:PKD repeat protein
VDKKGTYTLTVNDLINTCTSTADLLVDEQSSLTSIFEGSATLLSVKFADKTTGLIQSRLWNFGDGNFSSAINPWHLYAQDGVYYVCLTVYDSTSGGTCSSTWCDSVRAMPLPPSCDAQFAYYLSNNPDSVHHLRIRLEVYITGILVMGIFPIHQIHGICMQTMACTMSV